MADDDNVVKPRFRKLDTEVIDQLRALIVRLEAGETVHLALIYEGSDSPNFFTTITAPAESAIIWGNVIAQMGLRDLLDK